MAEMSISFTTGTGMTNLRHNNRELTEKEFNEPAHKHIKRDLSQNNIVIKQESLDEVYEREFGEALEKYNAKQKRKDRIITDYKNHVYHSKSLDLQREFIVGLGKKSDWDNLSPEMKQQAGEKIAEYIQEFEVRHPQLKVFNAVVHLDEAGAPHAHFNVVPVATGYKNGLEKQPSFSKALYQEGNHAKGKGQYREFRKEEVAKLEEKLKELGYDRKLVGTNNIKDMHEYKEIVGQANKELDEKLVSEYGAPVYINETTGEFVTEGEYQEIYKDFKETFGEYNVTEDDFKDFLDSDDIPLRKVTVQEKMDWVKQHYQQALNKLESSQKLSEARISNLDQKIEEKTKELSKIDLETSQKLSELSELEEHVNILEPQKNSLEAKIEGLRNEIEQLGSISDSELDSIRPKKGILGSKVELSPEQWSDFKGSYYKARNEAREMKQLAKMYAQKNQALANGDRFQNSLNKAKTEVKDSQIINLQNALKEKDKTISILEQKNKKLLGVAKQYMPQKMFQNLLEELQMIKPIVKVVRTVKSLFKD